MVFGSGGASCLLKNWLLIALAPEEPPKRELSRMANVLTDLFAVCICS
jgi:hypothetical protein